MFNNETGLYEHCDWLEDGDWFEDEQGLLYIVPTNAECEGPANDTMDKIIALCKDHGRLTDEDCETLNLTRIPNVLKRFNPEDGYYHA